jgi:hypothetical protein
VLTFRPSVNACAAVLEAPRLVQPLKHLITLVTLVFNHGTTISSTAATAYPLANCGLQTTKSGSPHSNTFTLNVEPLIMLLQQSSVQQLAWQLVAYNSSICCCWSEGFCCFCCLQYHM